MVQGRTQHQARIASVVLVATLAAALLAVLADSPAPNAEQPMGHSAATAPSITPTAKQPGSRPAPVSAHQHTGQHSSAAVPMLATGATLIQLGARELQALVDSGGGELELSELGASVSLQVQSISSRAGNRHVRLRSAHGLVSTVTLRPDRYAATIATPLGVFRIRGLDEHGWASAHRSLDDRIVVERDYVRVEHG